MHNLPEGSETFLAPLSPVFSLVQFVAKEFTLERYKTFRSVTILSSSSSSSSSNGVVDGHRMVVVFRELSHTTFAALHSSHLESATVAWLVAELVELSFADALDESFD